MDAPLAVAVAVKEVGVIAATLAAVAGLLMPKPSQRAVGMLIALGLVPVLVVGEVWHSAQFDTVRAHPGAAAAAAVAGLALMAGLAALVLRHPRAFPLLAVAALPFRIPIDVAGGRAANLLVPLYVVVGAGVLAYAWERLNPDPFAPAPRELARSRPLRFPKRRRARRPPRPSRPHAR